MAELSTLSAEEAAALLHVKVKQVQSMARSGRLPATRLGRKWLFHRSQIERLLEAPAAPEPRGFGISARNRLSGRIVRIEVEGLMAEVTMRIGDQELTSVITRSSKERLGLEVGGRAYAIIKSTEVMIGTEDTGE